MYIGSWNDLLAGALHDQDPSKVWFIVRSWNGTPSANSPNEALIHNKKTLTDPKAKSNAFAQHYANVSTLAMSTEDRRLNLRFKKGQEARQPTTKAAQPSQWQNLKKPLPR